MMTIGQGKLEIRNYGQIAYMPLPEGWIETSAVQQTGVQSIREFRPIEHASIGLYIYYRGMPLKSRSAKDLKEILCSDAHDLDENEWWSVQEVVRDAALPDAFDLNFARTGEWNGRQILLVNGYWTRTQENSFTIYVPADLACSQIQEIIFVAPQIKHRLFSEEVASCLQRIEWVSQPR